MGGIMDKKIRFYEITQFIFHKIILGVIGWLVISWLMKYQQKSIINLAPFIIYIWFLFTSNKKSKWDVFDKNTNIIAIVITAVTILVLGFIIGSAKIFI
jgi:hypothetical protein